MGKVTFNMLVDMCNKVGWDKGIKALEKETFKLENLQASLFGGSQSQVKQAIKLSKTIIRQNLTIAKLKDYKRENIDKPKSVIAKDES